MAHRTELTSALKDLTGTHRPARRDALFVQTFCADGVAQIDWLVENLQHGDIGLAADLEAADPILPADSACGIYGAGSDDLSPGSIREE